MVKPKIKRDEFADHCGTCRFCHQGDIGNFNCWVEPPVYAYGEEDQPVFVRGQADVKCTDYACRFYINRNPQ